jgi:hypothetical protein
MPVSYENEKEHADAELMARYDITRVPADYFIYRQYRYTKLQDAVAQAERDNLTASEMSERTTG